MESEPDVDLSDVAADTIMNRFLIAWDRLPAEDRRELVEHAERLAGTPSARTD